MIEPKQAFKRFIIIDLLLVIISILIFYLKSQSTIFYGILIALVISVVATIIVGVKVNEGWDSINKSLAILFIILYIGYLGLIIAVIALGDISPRTIASIVSTIAILIFSLAYYIHVKMKN